MTKIVYNACYGGYSLSEKAILRYAELKGMTLYASKDHRFSMTSFTTIPYEEYEILYEADAELGNFSRSIEAYFCDSDIERDDPVLVQVVEELGDEANGPCAKLRIRDLKPGTLYRIDEYDGDESVMTQEDHNWKIA